MKKTFLKMKIKSLAVEARIIRAEERKWPGLPYNWAEQEKPSPYIWMRHSLWSHRTGDVRSEARSALLAYAYLRGRRYRQLEKVAYSNPDGDRIAELVAKFGGQDKKIAKAAILGWLHKEDVVERKVA